MRVTVIALLISCLGGLHAAHSTSTTVWVAGYWGPSSCGEQQWVQGGYCAQPATVVVQQPAQVIVVPPPAPVWVAGGWVWSNEQWVWREGYWSAPPAYQPQPVYQAQPVYIQPSQPACARPQVSIGVGLGIGHGGGHHGHHGYQEDHHNDTVPPIPFVPGSHALPRLPSHLPDPLGLFRHDPLGLLKHH